MRKKGYFIVIEGIDGSGKTTQTRLVAEEIRKMGHTVCTGREPGGTMIGEEIRGILKNPAFLGIMRPEASLLLFFAARVQFIHQIVKPALEAGEIFITDRFFLSTLAYQAYGEGMNVSEVRTKCNEAMGGVFPDMIFVLDVTVEEARRRLAQEKKDDRYEKMGDDFLARVRRGYLYEAQETYKETARVISAHSPAEEVTADIMKNIRMLIR